MKTAPTPQQLAKLPKWAQEHIADLDYRATVAERTLKEFYDNETPSNFFTESWDSKQNQIVRRYIQTHRLIMERDGLRVDFFVRQDDPGLDIVWYDTTRLCKEVCMVPVGFQSIRLMLRRDMKEYPNFAE